MSATKVSKDVKVSESLEEKEEVLPKVQLTRILKRNQPEFLYILIGVLASCGIGAVLPVFAVIFGDILGVLAYEDIAQARSDSVYYSYLFSVLGLFAFTMMFLQVTHPLIWNLVGICFILGLDVWSVWGESDCKNEEGCI